MEGGRPTACGARWQGHSSRLLRWALLLGVLLVVCWTNPAQAYSWMQRHGYSSCSVCHADPSGGELLTPYGRVTADMILRMQYGERPADAPPPKAGVLWGAWEPPSELLLGGTYRNLYLIRPSQSGDEFTFVPAMQADVYGQVRLGWFRAGGSLGLGRAKEDLIHGRPAQVTTVEDGYNLLSRTHFVGADITDELLLRGGRINLPYGLRIPEHTSWVREATRTDRESDQQHGISLAYAGSKLRGELMTILGNYQLGPDEYRERGYSLFFEAHASSKFSAGINSKVTFAKRDRLTFEPDSLRQSHGLTARWAPLSKVAMMLEGDALFRTNADPGYAGFLQFDYEMLTGLHLLLTGELLDEGLPLLERPEPSPGVGKPRFGGWVGADWFFFKQMEFRADAIFRQEDPFTLLGQLHVYL